MPHGLGHPLHGPGRVGLLGVERLRPGRGGLRELGHVTQPLPLPEKPLLVARLHALCAGDELTELLEALRAPGGRSGQLLAAATGRDQLTPCAPEIGAAAQLLLADEGVQHVELVRGAGEAALLELSGHGEQALDERGQVLARHGAAPYVGACAPVGKDTPGGDEPLLAGRPQLGDGRVLRVVQDAVGQVELGLHVGLLGPGTEIARRRRERPAEARPPARRSSSPPRSRP